MGHGMVFDEAHFLKNADAARTQAARGLKRAFTLGLTGTPENRTGELWSLFSVLLPGCWARAPASGRLRRAH